MRTRAKNRVLSHSAVGRHGRRWSRTMRRPFWPSASLPTTANPQQGELCVTVRVPASTPIHLGAPMFGRADRPRFRPRRMRVVSNPGIIPPTPHYSPVESINALKTIGSGLQHPNNSGNAGGVTNVMPGLYAAGGSSHRVGRRLADQNDRYWQLAVG